MYEDEVLKVNVARYSRYTLQLRVEGRRFDRITVRLGSNEDPRCILVPFFVCVCTDDYPCAEEDGGYEVHRNKFLRNVRTANVTSHQKKVFSYDHLPDLSRGIFRASKMIPLFKGLYADYGSTGTAVSVKFGYF